MDRIIKMVDWYKVGRWVAQATIGCSIVLIGLGILAGAALGLWAVWDEMIRPLIDVIGLYILVIPPVLFVLFYLGWRLAGKIIDAWVPPLV